MNQIASKWKSKKFETVDLTSDCESKKDKQNVSHTKGESMQAAKEDAVEVEVIQPFKVSKPKPEIVDLTEEVKYEGNGFSLRHIDDGAAVLKSEKGRQKLHRNMDEKREQEETNDAKQNEDCAYDNKHMAMNSTGAKFGNSQGQTGDPSAVPGKRKGGANFVQAKKQKIDVQHQRTRKNPCAVPAKKRKSDVKGACVKRPKVLVKHQSNKKNSSAAPGKQRGIKNVMPVPLNEPVMSMELNNPKTALQQQDFNKEVMAKGTVNSSIGKQKEGFSFNFQDVKYENNESVTRLWKDEDVISKTVNIPSSNVKNVVMLLDQECTVPFIVRYRKEKIGNLNAEKVREIQMTYENVKALRKKVDSVLKTLSKQITDPKVINAFLNAQTMEEVDYLYAPFKPGSKRLLAARAKELGLEPHAMDILEGRKSLSTLNIKSIVNHTVKGLSTEEEVKKGMQNIIADVIAKDRQILDFILPHPLQNRTEIHCSESASAKKLEKQAYIEGKSTQNFKFENYYKFKAFANSINPHQVMAINRGEAQKILTVKLVIQPAFKTQIFAKCWNHFCRQRYLDYETKEFMNMCINDAYNRLLEPHICRHIRCELTKKSEKESVDVFCQNLKRLLLTPPVRGKIVLGIDPGYKHGCKMAVVSCTGEVLETDVIYPLNRNLQYTKDDSDFKLVNTVSKYMATTIAIGNGSGCRDFESRLSTLIESNAFSPYEVKYCIVNESGASIYSVTKEAEADLPGLDPNLRSAVSIARRIQDPLLEYVKVDPKHLGVGMYQHDVPEAMLKSALEGVVVESVSFVGVDLNVCPLVLLRKISGLSVAKAKQIVEWREKNGCFINRQQLLEVKGLGPKSFEQCAGFVKVLPETSAKEIYASSQMLPPDPKKRKKQLNVPAVPNLLDTTVIHPESYDIAERFLKELNATPYEIGKQSLVNKVKNFKSCTSVEKIAEKFGIPTPSMQLITDAFSQLMEYDIRAEFDVPLFKTGVMSMKDLHTNQMLTGRVANVTHFGAFVDIGVGQDGLIHISKMKRRSVQLGDRVSVKVLSVNVMKKWIKLELC